MFCSIFVLMMQGEPLSATLPEDSGLGERFWYWRGASGRRYIHSVYQHDHCPPVPGAVFVVVNVRNGVRQPVAVGRFPVEFDLNMSLATKHLLGDEEIHVHLLARDSAAAGLVLADLTAAMHEVVLVPTPETGLLARPVQLELLAA
jgi:hypothetical protein